MPRTTGTCAREKPVARAMAPPYHFHSLTVTSPHTVEYHSPLPTVRLTCTTPHSPRFASGVPLPTVLISQRTVYQSPSHPWRLSSLRTPPSPPSQVPRR